LNTRLVSKEVINSSEELDEGKDTDTFLETDSHLKVFEENLNKKAEEASNNAQKEMGQQVLPGCESFAKQINEALINKDVGARDPLGQRFSKFIKQNPEEAKKYASCGGVTQKKQFKLQWASAKLGEIVTSEKTKLEVTC